MKNDFDSRTRPKSASLDTESGFLIGSAYRHYASKAVVVDGRRLPKWLGGALDAFHPLLQ
ncbi:hypothetical protein GGQ88_004007 [Novosphingobium hassiacum]|uniref:Uncharacterized protein n=1 Tax=Novosphingobium hassiacum TaxID=173676 RepID=A0A7W5ZZ35_9SPHN|nr:hypothetical protein [Novosphingobium hassiacum]